MLSEQERGEREEQEERVNEAIDNLNQGSMKSVTEAALNFEVPETTLRRRRNGIPFKGKSKPKSSKLTAIEEHVLVGRILDLDDRGFAPCVSDVRDMAQYLLDVRAGGKLGKNWCTNFVKRKPELRSAFSRPYDAKRARSHDPDVIRKWFDLFQRTVEKNGIDKADIYNLDEVGFMLGMTKSSRVVTSSERKGHPKKIQPGDRRFVTVIQGICSDGWAMPPFFIFSGSYHIESWYEDGRVLPEWKIALNENGWATNEIGLEYVKYFHQQTKGRASGRKRLLIVDGHVSHKSFEFMSFCEENGIVTICLPPHSTDILQPLDICCFPSLKRRYVKQLNDLSDAKVSTVSKEVFLDFFKVAFFAAFKESTVISSFRAAGLCPLDPEKVLENLDVRACTPPPATSQDAPWVPRTPKNSAEVIEQGNYAVHRIQQHINSSPSEVVETVDQLARGAQSVALKSTLIELRANKLEQLVKSLTGSRGRRRLQQLGTLSGEQAQELQRARNLRGQRTNIRGRRLCGICRLPGHRRERCPSRIAHVAEVADI